MSRSCYFFLSLLLTLTSIAGDEHDHRVSTTQRRSALTSAVFSLQYEEGSEVVLWMNTVGPYHNRQETYNYYSLPFCRGTKKEISHYHETLGENILGVELEYSGAEINFKRKISSWIIRHAMRCFSLGRSIQVIKRNQKSVK